MVFSEDNYGRFEAMAFVLAWVAVGSAATILILDGAYLIGHGLSSFRVVIRSGVVIGFAAWLVPTALSRLREVGEILRHDHAPIPKSMMIGIVLASLAVGAIAIVAHQHYLLAYFERLGLPWTATTAPALSMAVLVVIAVAFAGAAAWLALFPAAAPD